ncbi:hypothetical protein K443DRAFT_11917 [Laccaria amethystina LaAM-08-1]|uniref:Uncharacterized protein n=1 Tax=Laccaria amethystina LaAM-08-1 TaxID=1095629 RepID=A0A0C9WJG6_9AGAR|nr:hypothetical protein K443DRAFT_11917 [Laccaria amethystina LaAM-08-1]
MTTKFSTIALHLDLPPVHPTPADPNLFSLLNVHKHSVQVPSPTPSSLRSCASPHLFFRVKDGSPIRPISLRASRTISSPWTSDDESALAFHGSICDPSRAAIKLFILKCNGFWLTSPVNDGSTYFKRFKLAPLPLTPSFCKAKRTKRRSTCQSYPAPPIPRLTPVSSSVMTSSSSPRHLFSSSPSSPLPPTPTPMSHIRCYVDRLQDLALQ